MPPGTFYCLFFAFDPTQFGTGRHRAHTLTHYHVESGFDSINGILFSKLEVTVYSSGHKTSIETNLERLVCEKYDQNLVLEELMNVC